MPKIQIRRLLLISACQLLLAPPESLARDPWDPISFAPSVGSWAGNLLYQPSAGQCYEDDDLACDLDVDTVRACEKRQDQRGVAVQMSEVRAIAVCSKNPYFPKGNNCERCEAQKATPNQPNPRAEWVVIQDSKNPNAFELEFGSVEFRSTPFSDAEDDIFYLNFRYLRYLLQLGLRDRFRLFGSLGVGVYDVGPDEDLGMNAKLGVDYGLNPKALVERKIYRTLEFGIAYHRLFSGHDTRPHAYLGLRFLFPATRLR